MRSAAQGTAVDLSPPPPERGVGRFLWAPGVDRAAAVAAFNHVHPIDRFGPRIHLALAMLALFAMGLPMSWCEVGVIPLAVCFLIRLPFIARSLPAILGQPLTLLAAALGAWQLLTLFWSRDVGLGIEQAGALRFIWLIVGLWPVIHRRHLLVAALAAGFIAGNLAQLARAVGVRQGIDWAFIEPFTDRNGGWWPNVAGGEMLAAAFGLHLPAAVMGRTLRVRLLAAGLAAVTLLGLFATGTRAAFIAAALLIPLVLAVALWRVPDRRRRLRLVVGALGAVAAAALLVGVLLGPRIAGRVSQAGAQYARAVERGDYNSDDGLRLLMARWGWEAFAARPLAGIGVGSFPLWVRDEAAQPDPAAYRRFADADHAHPHNALLHAGATGGLPSVLLLIAVAGLAVRNALATLGPDGLGTYAAGPAFALVALCLLWPFDAVQAAAHPAALACALVALCPAWRPRS